MISKLRTFKAKHTVSIKRTVLNLKKNHITKLENMSTETIKTRENDLRDLLLK